MSKSTVSTHGAAKLGATLNAAIPSGTDSDFISYQWYAGGNPIRGANHRSYTPDSGVIGEIISVRVSYSAPDIGDKNTVAGIHIKGVAAVGSELEARVYDNDGVPAKGVSYQWYADGNPIREATKKTYTPDHGVIGEHISVQAVYKDESGHIERPMSAASAQVATTPELGNHQAVVSIRGNAIVGNELVAQIDDVNGVSDRVNYQWYAGGNPIHGATKSTYTPDSGVVGEYIVVRVNYTDDANFVEDVLSTTTVNIVGSEESAPQITDPTIDNSAGNIIIRGNKSGVLTAKISDADGVSKSDISYEWFADGRVIKGATGHTYKLSSDEAGKTITVKASYIDKNGTAETVISDKSATIYVPKPASEFVADVTDYGARGDGRTDDTSAIQQAVNAAAHQGGGTVYIPDGNYMIDTTTRIWMRDNVSVQMEDDTVLEAIASDQSTHYVFFVRDVNNVHISGGSIIGDRDSHFGHGGHYGIGIGILGATNVTVENVHVQDFRGDGVYIGENKGTSENVTLYNVVSDNNLRQGITIVDGNDIQIINSIFKNTNGARPGAGIDIEPNDNDLVTNVDILSSKFLDNEGPGIVISETLKGKNHEINNIMVDGNEVIGNGFDIRLNGVSDAQFTNNYIDGVDTALASDGRVLASVILNDKTSNIEVSGNTIVTTGNEVRRADIDDRGHNNHVFDNLVMGTGAHDILKGGLGNDILNAGKGDDQIIGGAGDELIIGGSGRDTLTGGAGADVFGFNHAISGNNVETITDFSSSQGDKIGLSDVVFDDIGSSDHWFSTDHISHDTRIIQKGKDLYYDADGSRSAHQEVLFAHVNQPLHADDFIFF